LTNNGDCLLWTGSVTAKGFPRQRSGATYVSPHRVLYEQHTGQPLGRLTLRRTCGNRLCISPYHAAAVDRSRLMLSSDEPFATNQHSGHRGVYRHGRRWRAQIRRHGHAITVGVFDAIGQAAEAARAARRKCSAA
jgi:hypothetical protein